MKLEEAFTLPQTRIAANGDPQQIRISFEKDGKRYHAYNSQQWPHFQPFSIQIIDLDGPVGPSQQIQAGSFDGLRQGAIDVGIPFDEIEWNIEYIFM